MKRYLICLAVATVVICGMFLFEHVMMLKANEYMAAALTLTKMQIYLLSVSWFWYRFGWLITIITAGVFSFLYGRVRSQG